MLKRSMRSNPRLIEVETGVLGWESGQSLVELALLTPLLLILVIGVMEMGRFAYFAILVGNAARAGAAYGAQTVAQSADTADIQTAARNDFQNGQNLGSLLTVASCTSCGCDTGGTVAAGSCGSPGSGCTGTGAGTCPSGQHWVVAVSVTATGTFNSMFGYPGIPKSITVSRTCTMRVNQ